MSKTFFDLTAAERARRAKLTPKEQAAVDTFLAAARALPKTLSISLDDFDDAQDTLAVYKRITRGSAQRVAGITKRSLCF